MREKEEIKQKKKGEGDDDEERIISIALKIAQWKIDQERDQQAQKRKKYRLVQVPN